MKALVEASDLHDAQPMSKLPVELFHLHLSQSCKLIQPSRYKPRRRYYVQPCLRTNYSQIVRKSRLLAKFLTIGNTSDQTPGDRRKQVLLSDQLKPIPASPLLAIRCKCLFLGGGGFKIANSTTPCHSRICINRSRTKYDWNSSESEGLIPLSKRIRHNSGPFPVRNRRLIAKITRERASEDISDIAVPRSAMQRRRNDPINMSFKVKGRGRRLFQQF